MPRLRPLAALSWLALAGCAMQPYVPRPLDAAAAQHEQLDARADDDAARDALARAGVDVSAWPLPRWDRRALTALALSRRPELALARAELGAAAGAQRTARQPPNPALGLSLEHHSVPGASDSPWTLAVALDALAGGGSRRAALAERADALADAAMQQVAEAAWQVRRSVRDACDALAAAGERATALDAAAAVQRETAALWEGRLAAGAADATRVAEARRLAADAARRAREAHEVEERARQALAAALALPAERLDALPIDAAAPAAPPAAPAALQREALQDRIDVRAQLARYAAADAALRVELARQWPELTLKPGYAWDQGDNRWSVGVGFALPLWDRNAGPIAEASARRDAEGARFVALQAQAIAALDAARLAARAADAAVEAARGRAANAAAQRRRAERRLDAGDADRAELLAARLADADAARDVADAHAARAAARAAMEDALQRPLDAAAGAPRVATRP